MLEKFDFNHEAAKLYTKHSVSWLNFTDYKRYDALNVLFCYYFEKIKTDFNNFRVDHIPKPLWKSQGEQIVWDEALILRISDFEIFREEFHDFPDQVSVYYSYGPRCHDKTNYLPDVCHIIHEKFDVLNSKKLELRKTIYCMNSKNASFDSITWLGLDFYLFLNSSHIDLQTIRSLSIIGWRLIERETEEMLKNFFHVIYKNEAILSHLKKELTWKLTIKLAFFWLL